MFVRTRKAHVPLYLLPLYGYIQVMARSSISVYKFRGWLALLLVALLVLVVVARMVNRGPTVSDQRQQQTALQRYAALQEEIEVAMDHRRDLTSYIDDLQRLLPDLPDKADAYRLLGMCWLRHQDYEQGYEALVESLRINPRQAEVALIAGTAAYHLGDAQRAIGHYSDVISFEADNTRARLHMATAYMHVQDYERARGILLEALSIDSNLHQAHALLADLYARQNRTTLALDRIVRALALLPEDDQDRRTQYVVTRATLLRRANQPEEALSVLLELPRDKLIREPVIDDVATCYVMMGQPELAAVVYDRALLTRPTSTHLLAGAAYWYLQSGQPGEARLHLNSLRRINPRHEKLAELEAELRRQEEEGS